MAKLDQRRTPFLDALKKYAAEDVVPFDVPGHHMGNIDNKATKLFGKKLFRYDVNAPIGTDNLAKPHGPLLQAERLLAEATGADEAFFLINGTSSGIIAMIIAVPIGMILISLYDSGAFDDLIADVKTLAEGLNDYRKRD